MPQKSKRLKKIIRYTLIALVVLLIAFRVYLPTLVKNYVNKVLADIPGYYGQVDDIDISLFRGAYVIKGMYLNKVDASSEIPFLKFPNSDISIEWKSLFKGKIVSEIIMDSPEIIYVFEDQQGESENVPEADDWTDALTDLVPIDINHFEIHQGKLAFVQLSADPNIDLNISQLELTADNLRNVKSRDLTLPSTIVASGKSIGNGDLKLEGNINLIKEVPDMDIAVSLENIDVTALNDATQHYASIDFKEGNLGFFSEIAIADGHLKGYMKPLLADAVLIDKEDGFLSVLWEGFVGFFKFVLKNQKTNTVATKIPIEGDLNDVDTAVWPTILSIFENAWIEAFKGIVDNDIQFKDAIKEGKQS